MGGKNFSRGDSPLPGYGPAYTRSSFCNIFAIEKALAGRKSIRVPYVVQACPVGFICRKQLGSTTCVHHNLPNALLPIFAQSVKTFWWSSWLDHYLPLHFMRQWFLTGWKSGGSSKGMSLFSFNPLMKFFFKESVRYPDLWRLEKFPTKFHVIRGVLSALIIFSDSGNPNRVPKTPQKILLWCTNNNCYHFD